MRRAARAAGATSSSLTACPWRSRSPSRQRRPAMRQHRRKGFLMRPHQAGAVPRQRHQVLLSTLRLAVLLSTWPPGDRPLVHRPLVFQVWFRAGLSRALMALALVRGERLDVGMRGNPGISEFPCDRWRVAREGLRLHLAARTAIPEAHDVARDFETGPCGGGRFQSAAVGHGEPFGSVIPVGRVTEHLNEQSQCGAGESRVACSFVGDRRPAAF